MNAPVRSMEDLLNSSVDELVDLKEFKPLPVGEYLMIFDWEKSDQPAGVRFILRVKEVVELAEPTEANMEEAAAPDAKESILFSFFSSKDGSDNSFGQGRLKEITNEVLKPIFGGETLGETLDNSKGAEVRVVLKHRADKTDKEKFYPEIKSFEMA